MLRNSYRFFVTSIRSKAISVVVNVVALALCTAGALVLLLYVNRELSYDSFHNSDNIYRVESRLWEGGSLTDSWATTTYGHAPAMAQHTPQIESYVRLTTQDGEQRVFYQDISYPESRYCYAEPNFFKIFNYPIIRGDRVTPLDRSLTLVISENAAKRYFGSADPLGQKLTFRTPKAERSFEVTAVMEDMPENSNLKYDFVLSYASIDYAMQNVWYIHGVYTYVKLKDGSSARDVENLFANYSTQYRTKALQHKDWKVELIPLEDIHLNTQKPYEKEVKGNPGTIAVLSLMALALMVIAWLNFFNLTVARALNRAKELVLRRVYGAARAAIVFQFLFDALIVNMVAVLMGIILVVVLSPLASSLIGVSIPVISLLDPLFFGLICVLIILGSIVIGLYPSFIILRVKMVDIMRGKFSSSVKANVIRQFALGFQLVCSFVLICGTLVVSNQLRHMRTQPLGLDTGNTVVVKYPSYNQNIEQSMEGFRSDLLGESCVRGVSVSGAVPGCEVANYFSVRQFGQDPSRGLLMQMLATDNSYSDLYGLKMVAGHGFYPDLESQQHHKVVINEQAAMALGYQTARQAVGSLISVEVVGEPLEIIGVAQDFHQQSLAEPYRPIVIIMKERMPMVATPYISIKFKDHQSLQSGTGRMIFLYDSCFPLSVIEYFVLDDFYANQYRVDQDFGHMFALATLLAIFVSCIGLWVVFLFVTRSRIAEVCLRKIYGASPVSLFLLLIGRFFTIVLLAGVVGGFASHYLFTSWLESYAFNVGVEWWVYLVSFAILILICLITILYQILRAIRENPVKLFQQ